MANRTIFVGDLSCFVSEQHLMQLFSPCGPISSVEIKRSASGDSLMHGFVKFLQEDAAILATRCFHDKKFMGRRMVVNPTTSRAPKKPYDQWHKLTLHFTSRRSDNLDITEEVLDLLCSNFGEIGDTVVRNHAPAEAMAAAQQSGRKAFGPITGKEIIGYAVVFFIDASAAQRAFEALHHQTIDQITFQCSISAHTAVSVLSHQLNPQIQIPPYLAQPTNNMNMSNMNMNMDMYAVNNIGSNGNMYMKDDSATNTVGFTSSFYHPNNHNNNNMGNNMGNNIRSNGSSGFGLPAPPQNTSPRQMQPPYVVSPMLDNLPMNAPHSLNNSNSANYNNNSLHPLLMASSSSSSSSLSLSQTKLSTNSSQMPQYPSNVNTWTNAHPTSHNMNVGANHSQLHSLNNVNNTSSLSLHSLMSPNNSFYVTPSLTSQPSFFSTSSATSLSTNNTAMNSNVNPSLKTVSVAGSNQQDDDGYFANLAHFHSHKSH